MIQVCKERQGSQNEAIKGYFIFWQIQFARWGAFFMQFVLKIVRQGCIIPIKIYRRRFDLEKIRAFLKRKDIVFTLQRYGIDALGAMAQGLFCTLLVGTILNTIGQQFNVEILNRIVVTIGSGDGAVGYTIGGLASAMVGPGIATAIGNALHCPPLVLFSLIPVGFAGNASHTRPKS